MFHFLLYNPIIIQDLTHHFTDIFRVTRAAQKAQTCMFLALNMVGTKYLGVNGEYNM